MNDLNNSTMSQTAATMSPVLSKVIAMFALGIGSLFFGLLPSYFGISTRRRHHLMISNLLCFGAGVLLATALIHILPEVREQMPKNAELILCCGFFFVYIVDELVHVCCGHDGIGHTHNEPVIVHTHQTYGSTSETRSLFGDVAQAQPDNVSRPDEDIQIHQITHPSTAGHAGLLLALSIHSVLEGLAIGVQDTTTKIFVLLGAVCCHKYVVGFCLGVELSSSESSRNQIVSILIFAFGSVLGIGIGMGLIDVNHINDGPALPVLQAIAAGTLLYVTVCEVLPREKAKFHMNSNRFAGFSQCISVVIGFTAMTLLTIFYTD